MIFIITLNSAYDSAGGSSSSPADSPTCTPPEDAVIDERLANIEPKMIELIKNEIIAKIKPVGEYFKIKTDSYLVNKVEKKYHGI